MTRVLCSHYSPWTSESHMEFHSFQSHFHLSTNLPEVLHEHSSETALPHETLVIYVDLSTPIAPDLMHINICYWFIVIFSHFHVCSRRSEICPFY